VLCALTDRVLIAAIAATIAPATANRTMRFNFPPQQVCYRANFLSMEDVLLLLKRLRDAFSDAMLPLVSEKTLFQKIMDREEPGDILYEDELCVVLRDINPQAPTHVLVIPRKPIPSLDALTEEDGPLVGHLFLVAQRVAADKGLTDGYRTVFNNGPDAHQTVAHVHLHLLGGRRMSWPPG
jgi:histidine triad (HIT) family protein